MFYHTATGRHDLGGVTEDTKFVQFREKETEE